MKKIININLSSRLIPIEDTAYELLKTYLDSLKLHFSREEGGDEIVADIEDRIAEIFQEKLKKGAHCITDDDVNSMVTAMGRPEQLEEEAATGPQQKQSNPQANAASGATPPPPAGAPKRLMRNENDKILGGVCSGIAAHFNIDPVIIRILTFLLILAWGTGLLVYIILWIVLPSSRTLQNTVRKRLYRNPDNKVIGGVASGIAAYLNLDPVVPRIIFVLPLLGIIFTSIFHHWFWFHGFFFPLSVGSLPTLIVLYIILWIAVPKANTVTEKLEMRGEKVDLQSITNAMKESQDEKKSDVESEKEPDNTVKASETGAANTYYQPPVVPRRRSGLGDAVILLLKIFAYFILAVIIIGICVALIGISGAFIGTAAFSSMWFPFKGLLLSSSLQKFLAWPATFLTLGIPVVAIIWLFIKLITGFKSKTKNVGISLFVLWIIGVICAVWLIISVGNDFRMNYRATSDISMQQPSQGHLLISGAPSDVAVSGWSTFGNFLEAADDTIILKTITLNILKSNDDSFHVQLVRASNGYSYEQARSYTDNISVNVSQLDSVLYIPNGFSIPQGIPFRNQRASLKVFVPVGKFIRIDENLSGLNLHRHWHFGFNNGDWNYNDNNDWDYNEEYQMTKDGLKSLDDLNNNNNDNNNQTPAPQDSSNKGQPYRYHGPSQDNNESNHSASIDPAVKTLFFNV